MSRYEVNVQFTMFINTDKTAEEVKANIQYELDGATFGNAENLSINVINTQSTVIQLIKQGKKVQAIKRVMENTNCGMLVAKRLVEELQQDIGE